MGKVAINRRGGAGRPRHPRPVRVEGDIAFVPLSRGFEAIIDAGDAEIVGAFNWSAKICSNAVYAVRAERISGKTKMTRLHRFILGNPPTPHIDHIDGNGLNNRRNNLRPASASQNAGNRLKSTASKAPFKGVTLIPSTGKWKAQITVNYKHIHLGIYDTPIEAHAAYAAAAQSAFGEFARTA